MNIDQKQKNLIIISFSILLTIAIYFFVINPTIAEIQAVRDEIKNQHEIMEKKYQQILYMKKNADKIQNIENQLYVLDELFLIKDNELKFSTTLEDIASSNEVSAKIQLDDVNINDPKQTTLPFSLTINGTMHNTLKYLLDLEQLKYYLNFDAMEIHKSIDINKSKNNINLKLKGKIFLLKI